jgi:hypothetical protein
MTKTLAPDPNDGPVTRWVIEHAKPLLAHDRDRQAFETEITRYRYARNRKELFVRVYWTIDIDGIRGDIEMLGDSDCYAVIITLVATSPTVWISDNFLEEGTDNLTGRKRLAVGSKVVLPDSVAESLVGQQAECFTKLTASLQPVIAGRTIVEINNSFGSVSVALSVDNE